MEVTPKSRRRARAENLLFVALLLAVMVLLAWLSTRYSVQSDWTSGGRRSLSGASAQLLKKIDGPVTATAFVSEGGNLRETVAGLVGRYQRHKSDFTLHFIDPLKEPGRVRDYEVTTDGELILEYQGRRERLKSFDQSEQTISNALQRLARGGERWLVFLEGHGERKPRGQANHDLTGWVRELEAKGFKILSLNLGESPQVPDNATVLVVAGPQVDLLPGEVTVIREFLERGGNLLWLADPGPLHGLQPVADLLGVGLQPGTLIDVGVGAQLLSVNNPAIAVIARYPRHPITQDFQLLTVFPLATGIKADVKEGWQAQAFLRSDERSWLEQGREVAYDEGSDILGPIDLGVGLTRKIGADEGGAEAAQSATGRQQRVVVLGDGDFLSNAYLGNGGNLDLGLNIVNWLSADEAFINVPAKTAPDSSLELTVTQFWVMAVGFLLGVPLLLLGAGVVIWLRRRKR